MIGLNEHQAKRHGVWHVGILPCPICKRVISKKKASRHSLRHSLMKSYRCEPCQTDYLTKRHLWLHSIVAHRQANPLKGTKEKTEAKKKNTTEREKRKEKEKSKKKEETKEKKKTTEREKRKEKEKSKKKEETKEKKKTKEKEETKKKNVAGIQRPCRPGQN